MKDEQIKIGVEEIRNIKMTPKEKKLVLENVLTFPISITQPVRSPFTFISIFQKHHFAFYSMASLLVIVLSSGGVAFASQESLPGNILYPIKVSIIEPINSALKFSTESKAKYESKLATERLIEAETLAYQGKLDAPKEKQINDLLAIHTTALDKSIKELKQNKSDEVASSIATNFQVEMNAHAQVLDIINEQKNIGIASSEYAIGQQVENAQISTTARINADKIRVSSNNNNKEDVAQTASEYAKKIESVKTMIDSTTSDLNQITTTSPVKQKIIEDTRKTLDESKKFLNEAHEQNTNGDPKDAYSSVLKSENAAKEADIFFKTGIQLEDKNNN
ncbi:MAG: DUF5667 domain-containing protein [bacterium]